MNRILKPRVALALLLVLSTEHPPVNAQKPQAGGRVAPSVRLSEKELGTFGSAFTALATQARVAFVAEGAPLRSTLSEQQVEVVKLNASLPELVGKLAAAYDYDAEQRGSLFLLKKRYTHPRDLPGVTLEECALAVQDLLRVMSAFNPRVPPPQGGKPDPLAKDLMATLTPEQLQAMAGKGVPIASLTPQQRAAVRRIALYFYVQNPATKAADALKRIHRATEADPAFGWGDLSGVRLFGYEMPAGSRNRPFFIPLSHPGQAAADADSVTITIRSSSNGAPAAPPDDPTAPVAENVAGDRDKGAHGSTLGEVVSALNARGDRLAPLAVDAALAPKPVTLIGGGTVAPASLLKALANVYGLRVRTEEDGTLRLTRPRYQVARTAAALPNVLRRVFPEPFLRALQSGKVEGRQETPLQLLAAPKNLRIEAVRRFRSVVEPLLKAANRERIPLSELGQPERMALANAFMADCLRGLGSILSAPVPSSITRFDDLYLTGGLQQGDDGKQKFSLFLSIATRDGRVVQGPGFGNVNYISNPRSSPK